MIIYFTGTGNSGFVASRLSTLMNERLTRIDRKFYDNPEVTLADGERLIWIFPIYSWGVPPVVKSVIERIDGVPTGTPTWMVATCGDDAGYADRTFDKLVGARGMKPMGAFTVQMPNTYVTMAGFDIDPEPKALGKIEHAPKRIAEIAALILKGTPATDVIRGSFPWLKTRVVYPWFMRYQVAPRHFNVDNRCVCCGKCADSCPLSNISMEAGRPAWGDTCAFCLNCYHVCPTHAIDWKHTAARKGQYSLATLIKKLRR